MKRHRFAIGIITALAAGSTHAASFGFSHYWTYTHLAGRGSEIASYDATDDKLWVIGGTGLDILDPSSKTVVDSIELSSFGTPNSVAIHDGRAAVALAAPTKTDPGVVQFYDTATRTFQQSVTVGALPDAVFFTSDGSKVLTANEGEPNSYGQGDSVDPEGSVSIIDTNNYSVQTANFNAYNGQEATLRGQGVRIFGPNASVAQDLEPEYIAIDKSGSRAYVTIQENNAVGVVDIPTATVTDIIPLGLKDHGRPGNGFDASDRDGPGNDPLNGNIRNWPVHGMYQPDGIGFYEVNGQPYLVTANEGDARDYTGFTEEVRVGSAGYPLDSALFPDPDLKSNNDKLNRLNVSVSTGNTDADQEYEQIHVFGARSFSIWDTTGNLVFDSGDQIEQIIKSEFPSLWDDGRSDNKGPEPEGLALLEILGRKLLFLGLERSNGVMVWDITLPNHPEFLNLLFNAGDVGPEGLTTFSNAQGTFLAVSNEVGAGTTTFYQIFAVPEPSSLFLFGAVIPGLLGRFHWKRKRQVHPV